MARPSGPTREDDHGAIGTWSRRTRRNEPHGLRWGVIRLPRARPEGRRCDLSTHCRLLDNWDPRCRRRTHSQDRVITLQRGVGRFSGSTPKTIEAMANTRCLHRVRVRAGRPFVIRDADDRPGDPADEPHSSASIVAGTGHAGGDGITNVIGSRTSTHFEGCAQPADQAVLSHRTPDGRRDGKESWHA